MTLKANSNLQSSLLHSAAGRSSIRSPYASHIRSRCAFQHLDTVSAAFFPRPQLTEYMADSASGLALEGLSLEFSYPASLLAEVPTWQDQRFTLAVADEEEDDEDEEDGDAEEDDADEEDDDLDEEDDEDEDFDEDEDEPEYDDEDDDLVDDEDDEDDE